VLEPKVEAVDALRGDVKALRLLAEGAQENREASYNAIRCNTAALKDLHSRHEDTATEVASLREALLRNVKLAGDTNAGLNCHVADMADLHRTLQRTTKAVTNVTSRQGAVASEVASLREALQRSSTQLEERVELCEQELCEQNVFNLDDALQSNVNTVNDVGRRVDAVESKQTSDHARLDNCESDVHDLKGDHESTGLVMGQLLQRVDMLEKAKTEPKPVVFPADTAYDLLEKTTRNKVHLKGLKQDVEHLEAWAGKTGNESATIFAQMQVQLNRAVEQVQQNSDAVQTLVADQKAQRDTQQMMLDQLAAMQSQLLQPVDIRTKLAERIYALEGSDTETRVGKVEDLAVQLVGEVANLSRRADEPADILTCRRLVCDELVAKQQVITRMARMNTTACGSGWQESMDVLSADLLP